MPRKVPFTRPRSRAAAAAKLMLELPVELRAGVVRVGHAAQPGLRLGAGPGVLHVFGHATRAGEEVGDRGRARVGDDLPGGRRDRGVRLRRFGRRAAIHLRARVGVHVELRPARVRGQRVGAAGDRLRLQRGERPARRASRPRRRRGRSVRAATFCTLRRPARARSRRPAPVRSLCRCSSGRGSPDRSSRARRSRAPRPGSCRRRGRRPRP